MEKELSGNYPIIIDGKETGRINVGREGLFWCFEASSETVSEGIIRLSVFGEGHEAYLGVMEPKESKLRLKKKLSRAAIADFPPSISHGGRQGEAGQEAVHAFAPEQNVVVVEQESVEPSANIETVEIGTAPEGADASIDGGACESCADEKPSAEEPEPSPQYEMPPPRPSFMRQAHEAEIIGSSPAEAPNAHAVNTPPPLIWKLCGCPAAYLSSLGAKSIFGNQKNVLESSDGEYTYLAIPEAAVKLSPGQEYIFGFKAVILGKPHLVCRIRSGRIE